MDIRFQTIAAQVAQTVREEIARRTWRDVLPGERQLAERLQVSRKTLRKALAQLRSEGVLVTHRGKSSSIAKARRARGRATNRIALLLPHPLEQARPFTLLWVNRLMGLLQDSGFYLEIFPGAKYYGETAAKTLSRLTNSYPSCCWILARSNRPLQEWFARSGLPTLICGSAHLDISLPSVDIDHRALCRHAATLLLRHGHRRIALFLESAGRAGDAESEQGFREGLESASGAAPAPVVTRVEHTSGSVIRELRQLMGLPQPPTGMLLFNSDIYLTVSSYLSSLGRRIPGDISLVARDEEPFLQFIYPAPARYSAQPFKFASRLSQALKRIISGDTEIFSLRIMPDFIAGGSVGQCPASGQDGHSAPENTRQRR